ncbi:hypothetical protein DNTS_020928 [Danionella cerebrum]|uniref:Uncharacterized protein n=1 Tax=Danionella cerebrum TaxID=2873325 RepID=A0A553QDW7_9TELE|nr:hypothetical protein DNTS_020928 [Danionella translucida]
MRQDRLGIENWLENCAFDEHNVEGEISFRKIISLDAMRIKLPRLPEGKASTTGPRQTVFEVCVCPNGKLFLSQAGTGSTCQMSSNLCL